MKCSIADLWMGVGEFKEISLSPHATPYRETPYHHYLDLMTDDVGDILEAVASLVTRANGDRPEATTQALYSVVTGKGLGPYVPNRASCPAGRWGYPCFRPGSLPIIILFTDAPMLNGPLPASVTYGNPPFNGILGAGALLPPVEQHRNMLFATDASTAHDLGDLSAKSVTVMGTNARFDDSAATWNVGSCLRGSSTNRYGDGYDAFVKFSLSVPTTVSVNGEGTNYPYANVALATSGGTFIGCDNGPGGGNYWGALNNYNLAAGDWFAISDAAVSPSSSANANRGPFQIRIQTTPRDPSWLTTDLPIPWAMSRTSSLTSGRENPHRHQPRARARPS